MKTILKILFIMMGIFFVPATLYSQTQADQPKSDSDDTLSFTVYGMDCPGCAGGLEKQVNKIPSVKSSGADWVNQELKVVMKQDSTLNIDELRKRVNKANFTLVTDDREGENEK